MRQRGLDQCEAGLNVDVEQPVEGCLVHLLDGASAEGGGIVDHDVEPAEGGGGLVDHGAGGCVVGNIDLPEDRLAAFSLDQAEGFLAMCRSTSGNDNSGAFTREGDRDGTADPLARAGDDGDFAGEAGAQFGCPRWSGSVVDDDAAGVEALVGA